MKMESNDELELCPLDSRKFTLKHKHVWNVLEDVEISLTQRELRMIMKHLDGRNTYLYDKLRKYIETVDNVERTNTNWNSKVPKTHVIFAHSN